MTVFLGILCVLLAAAVVGLLLENRRLRRLSAPAEPSTEAAPSAANDPDRELFLRLDALLDRDQLFLDPALDRERLCALLGVEKNRMGRLIKLYSGCRNLPAYVNGKRIAHAQKLMLQHPEWTLQAVAESSGLSNLGSFSRAFRDATGLPPTAWLRTQIGRRG